jgi:hypothetical protein
MPPRTLHHGSFGIELKRSTRYCNDTDYYILLTTGGRDVGIIWHEDTHEVRAGDVLISLFIYLGTNYRSFYNHVKRLQTCRIINIARMPGKDSNGCYLEGLG